MKSGSAEVAIGKSIDNKSSMPRSRVAALPAGSVVVFQVGDDDVGQKGFVDWTLVRDLVEAGALLVRERTAKRNRALDAVNKSILALYALLTILHVLAILP